MQSQDFDPGQFLKSKAAGDLDIRLDRVRGLSEREQRLATATSFIFKSWVTEVALAESVAVSGLILAIMLGDAHVVLPCAAASAVLLIKKRPRLQSAFARLEQFAR